MISFCCRAKGACHDCRNDAVRFRPAGAGAAAERFGDGQADVCWASALTGRPKQRPRSSEARARVKRRAALWWGAERARNRAVKAPQPVYALGCRRVVSTGPAPGAGRGAAAKRCRGVRGAGPLRRGEFERGNPLSCCRPGRALFIPYNSVLYKKERSHRPGTNPGGRSGAGRRAVSPVCILYKI